MNNGNFGIGVDTPVEQFQIGNIWTFHNGGTKYIGRNVRYASTQNVRIANGFASCIAFSENGSISLEAGGDGEAGSQVNTSGKRLRLTADGNVGIGTDDTHGFKLAVNGNVICEEVVVLLYENWPDYVFEKDHVLKPITEVEEFIQEHKHLPEIPSAAQVEENGVGLAEMNTLLLKKVEELTLYIIEQNKQISEQGRRIEALESALER